MPAKNPSLADVKNVPDKRVSALGPIPCASTNLRMAARATTRLYDKALAPVGLTVTQYAILASIFRAGEIATMDLAARLCLERTTLYRALAVLERRALIAVRPGHGREQFLSLTPAGTKLREGAFGAWNKVQQMFLEAFGEGWNDLLNQIRRAQKIAEQQLGADSLG